MRHFTTYTDLNGERHDPGPGSTVAARARGFLVLPVAIALAACGGGSSTGGLPLPTAPVVCTATADGGAGFALGVCADSATSAFQPVEAVVSPDDAPSYAITLAFPPRLPAGLSVSLAFTVADRTPQGTRDIVGELRGEAYEADADASPATLAPPYTALIDFRRAWLNSAALPLTDANAVMPPLAYASFGVWERFATASLSDGHFGGWYASRPGADAVDTRPTTPRQYSGVAVGVLSPSSPGGLYARSYGFSAAVTVSADRNGILSGAISQMKISYGAQTALVVEPVPLKVLSFTSPGNFAGQPSTAALVTSIGSGADATGAVEARFLGATGGSPASLGKEIAGRFRFQTTDGSKLIGVGSFGARAPDAQ